MATPKLSDALAQQALDAYARNSGARAKAAAECNIAEATFKSRLDVAKRRGMKPSPGLENPNDPNILRVRIKQLEAQLKSAERVQTDADIVRGVIGAMSRKVEDLEPPAWVTRERITETAPGVPTLFLSDLHWGEVVQPAQINNVNSYNLAIAHQRMKDCVETAVQLLKIISPKMDYPGIIVPLGGDLISGNIHEELTATNELNTMPTVLDLYSVLVWVVNYLADTFGHVFLPCVSGNHGRDTRKIWGKDRHATSFDWLICQFLARHFQDDKRVVFYIPDGSDAYYRVYSHRYLLTHGDQFRGGDGMIGALGPIIRGDHKKRSRNAQVDMEYDTMLLGHWHQYVHHSRVIVNGSMKGYDEYAYTNNFGYEVAQQALWITHPKHGITFRMPVQCERVKAAAKTDWVSVPK